MSTGSNVLVVIEGGAQHLSALAMAHCLAIAII